MLRVTNQNRAFLLAALYNRAKTQGLGILHYDPRDMTVEEAEAVLATGQRYFDYLKGRVMKVDLEGPEIDFRLYDRDNGLRAGEMVYEYVRSAIAKAMGKEKP